MTEALPFLDPINTIPGVRAAWIGRVPGLEIRGDRTVAMEQLRPIHEMEVRKFAGADAAWWRAEQVHGTEVAVVPGSATMDAPDGLPVVPGVDGLITNEPGVVLAIYVADCGPIWLADRETGAIGLLHSGKKGTEGNILAKALEAMALKFGTRPENVTVVLGPCIRPPQYDVDFAAEIGRQAGQAGIVDYHDLGENTGTDPEKHYSYRMEKGITGRMMALIRKEGGHSLP
ncbi:MAG: laccase domain-containing protein [Verrucomicrobiaceae bacterium]|nr:MAG: laccase domain-containing protein [Verrucomicrobiaceae bacterium]